MEWIKVESSVNWKRINYYISYLLLHDDGSMSIGYPYEHEHVEGAGLMLEGIGHPKMSVTHYMELPAYPDGVDFI
ncbi:hypothetical protein [Chitinophaga sp.]|uniref:hypothetical protein n=1 Tax=Chitinophaga sp. TaxID=1869181 RepID=UPI0031DE8C53